MGITTDDIDDSFMLIADKAYGGYGTLTADERVWFNCRTLFECAQSGIISFYYTEAADHISDTIEDLKTLGFVKPIELMEPVNALFGDGAMPDIEKRNEIINSWEDEKYNELFESTDEKFAAIERGFEKAINEFAVRKNMVKIDK